MTNELIETFLALVEAYMKNSTEANVDAVEAFEEAHPGIADAVYQAAGPLSYEMVSGVVSAARTP